MESKNLAGGGSAGAAPRRSRVAIILPVGVAALTLGLVLWTAWPTVRPVRRVEVTQAVFERTSGEGGAAAGVVQAEESAPVGRGVTVQAAGWLEAEPFYVACTALADGVVESIDVLEGDLVEAGQVVARLVSEDSELKLSRAEAELAAARAELASGEAELAAARTGWDEPVERERAVEAGRAALAESEAELAQLPSLIESAEATRVRLAEEAARTEEARQSGAATDLEVIVARQRAAAQRAEVASLEARRGILSARVERLRAELRAAERHLDLLVEEKLALESARAAVARASAAVARAETARDEAALELSRMTIRAPIGGYVQRRLKLVGDKVMLGMDSPHSAHLVHLYDPERLQVRVDVPLADASHVFVGQRCEVVVEVLPDRVFGGQVLRTTHEADLQKNTLEIKVKVENPSPMLRPEMLTRVKFLPRGGSAGAPAGPGANAPGRVLAPAAAIDNAGGSARVWAVTDRRGGRGVVHPIPVQRVGEEDGWVTVSGAVRAGSLLVVSPEGLRDGQAVQVDRGEGGR